MENLLEELTIIVPTKNRVIWLKRIFEYYSRLNFEGKIIIADSSDVNIFEKINEIKNIYQNLKIYTFNLPSLNCESAINAVSDKIDTRYSVFLADDDLLLIDGLNKAINFLNNNKSYIAALGKSYMLGTINNQAFGSVTSIVNYNLRSYDHENILERIEDYFSNTRLIGSAVTLSETFIESYKIMMNLDKCYQTFIFGENIQAVCYLSKGKIIKLETEYLVRQSHPENTYHKLDYSIWSAEKELNNAFNYIKIYTKSIFNFKKNDQVEDLLTKYLRKTIDSLSDKKNRKTLIGTFKKFLPMYLIKKIIFIFFDLHNVKKFKKTTQLNEYLEIVQLKK